MHTDKVRIDNDIRNNVRKQMGYKCPNCLAVIPEFHVTQFTSYNNSLNFNMPKYFTVN